MSGEGDGWTDELDDEDDIDAGYNDDDWSESSEECRTCGAPAETRGWWDDAPSNGGACIGTLVRCTRCDWSVDL